MIQFRRTLFKVISLFAFIGLSACGNSYIYYTTLNASNSPSSVKSALLNKNSPTQATQTNLNIGVGGWRLDALSASPSSGYLALGFLDINQPVRNSNGKLEIYRQFGRVLAFTYNDADIKRMIIESSDNDIDYPASVYAFHPFALGYQNNKTLIVQIQPQGAGGGDSVPLNVEIKIDLVSGTVVGNAVFYERTQPRPLPVHPQNNRYNLEVINGVMSLNSQVINGLPSNLSKDLFDQTVIGN